ncbi:MAG TPA: hypothetical protein PLP29_01560 [Candidatus Ozemobacteraceae bacterium]|nr:hypothetical protein [Candidatus Ozemobacteraceae bacterium]
MLKQRSARIWSWLLIFTFVAQLVAAEVVPAPAGEVVPTREVVPAAEVVPAGEVVPAAEVVPAHEVVPGATAQKGPANVPAINPFVGEIAVGVSLLITYGPQILALAATVASIAAAVSVIVNTSKQSVGLVQSIGSKMSNMLQLLLGPLGISTGMTKDGVEGLSGELLNVTKYVTNSISTPVSQVKGQVDKSLTMARDVQSLATRGSSVAGKIEQYARTTGTELGRITAGGEVQMFRDGARTVAQRLEKEASQAGGAFRLTLDNTSKTTSSLERVQKTIDDALAASGKQAGDVTLHDINLSGAKLSKELIEARKYMVLSNNALVAADKSAKGVHTQIMEILNDVKTELEAFALANGVGKDQLDRIAKEQRVKMSGPAGESTLPLSGGEGQKLTAKSISEEIGFMVDELGRISADAGNRAGLAPAAAQSSAPAMRESTARDRNKAASDAAYQKMIGAYKTYLGVMTANPADKAGIEAAKASYDAAQEAYQTTLQPGR